MPDPIGFNPAQTDATADDYITPITTLPDTSWVLVPKADPNNTGKTIYEKITIANLKAALAPTQPAFAVFATDDNTDATSEGNITISGANSSPNATGIIPYNHEHFDTGTLFDTSSHKFTVPTGMAGRWYFSFGVYAVSSIATAVLIKESAGSFSFFGTQGKTGGSSGVGLNGDGAINLAEGDKVFVKVKSNGTIYGDDGHTEFMGFKLF